MGPLFTHNKRLGELEAAARPSTMGKDSGDEIVAIAKYAKSKGEEDMRVVKKEKKEYTLIDQETDLLL